MKSIAFSYLFMFTPILFFAQKNNEYKKYNQFHYKNIEWGNRLYDNSMRGVILLLKDVVEIDPELHNLLNKELRKYQRNGRESYLYTGLGVSIGAGFILSGIFEYELLGIDDPGESLGLGLLCIVGSLLMGNATKSNQRKFIFRFINLFNENTSGDKVKYAFRPLINLNNNPSLGLSFTIYF